MSKAETQHVRAEPLPSRSRVMNRIKAMYRSRGIACGGKEVYSPPHRASWGSRLPRPACTGGLSFSIRNSKTCGIDVGKPSGHWLDWRSKTGAGAFTTRNQRDPWRCRLENLKRQLHDFGICRFHSPSLPRPRYSKVRLIPSIRWRIKDAMGAKTAFAMAVRARSF